MKDRRTRRINRGTPKSKKDVTMQEVEDLIESRLQEVTEVYNETIGVLVAKVLFHQEQIRCAGHALDLFTSEIANRGMNTRELMLLLVEQQSAIFNDLIPVNSDAEYAALTKPIIQAHLERHCGDYNGDDMDVDPYENDEAPIREVRPEGIPPELLEAGLPANAMRAARRRRREDDRVEDSEDDDILSAVSDEVQEDFSPRSSGSSYSSPNRRRRRR